MNPAHPKPGNTEKEAQTTTPEQATPQPAVAEKKFPKKLLLIGAAGLIGLAFTGTLLTKTVFNNSSERTADFQNVEKNNQTLPKPKAVEQVFVSPVDGKKTEIKKAEYYSVVVGDTEYVGLVSKINNDYVRVSPAAYKNGNTLTFTGNELHGPEAATYFRVSKVTKFQVLTDTEVIEAVKTANTSISDAFPSSDINEYVKSGQFQAYFFADGSAFFAKTTSLDGNFLANSSNVYVLRTDNPGGMTISLELAKPDSYNIRVSADLTHWQNMKSDSQIATAVAEFEKNQ